MQLLLQKQGNIITDLQILCFLNIFNHKSEVYTTDLKKKMKILSILLHIWGTISPHENKVEVSNHLGTPLKLASTNSEVRGSLINDMDLLPDTYDTFGLFGSKVFPSDNN